MHVDSVRSYAASQPDRLAVGCAETGRTWSWADLNRNADRIAAWLVDRFGEASGERVAVLARNHPLLLLLQFGCARSGTIFVPLNWRLASAELDTIIADADPALIFVGQDFDLNTGDVEQQIEAFVEHYNHQHYHDSLNNVTPADAYFGRGQAIIQQLERIKRKTIEYRRLQHRKLAA